VSTDSSIILLFIIASATSMASELERQLLRLENLSRGNQWLQEENKELRKEIAQLKADSAKKDEKIQELQNALLELTEKFDKLQKQLRKYHNENTPSGALPPYLKDELTKIVKNAEEPPPETKSAKSNPRNKRPKPDRTEVHGCLEKCPKCRRKLRKLKKRRERVIIHLSFPVSETVLHQSEVYFCDHCDKEFAAQVPDAIPNSKYDLNICLLVLLLNAIGTTQRKTMEILGWFGVLMCPATTNNIICNMQKLLGTRKYRELEKDIRKTLFGAYDKTTHRHHGMTYYVQAVATARTAFYRIFASGTYATAKKLPATKFGGTSDGTREYDAILKAIQRCWAHLLRRINYPARTFNEQWEIGQFVAFSEKIGRLFHDAKHEKRRSVAVRKKYDSMLRGIALAQYKKEANLTEVLNYILSYEGEWFTFLRYKGMKPTNNDVERALRPLVIRRKVSQHTWGSQGPQPLAIVQSLRETCKLRGESFPELARHEVEHSLHEMGKS
jgi:hypothetical protein